MNEKRSTPALELRVIGGTDGKPPVITGYAAVFNSLSQPLGQGREQFRELILPGAFKRAIAEKQEVRAMYNHDQILARTKNGTLKLEEDSRGLRFEAQVNPADPQAMSVAAKISRGDVDGCSFAFRTQKDSWKADDSGQAVRELIDVDLADVGPVDWPAYLATTVDVRSIRSAIDKLPRREHRATMEVQDDSLICVCRGAISYSRYAFDAFQRVIDVANTITGDLSDADQEAIDDCVDNLADVIAKARKARAILDAMGADDEDPQDAPTDDEARAAKTEQEKRANKIKLFTL